MQAKKVPKPIMCFVIENIRAPPGFYQGIEIIEGKGGNQCYQVNDGSKSSEIVDKFRKVSVNALWEVRKKGKKPDPLKGESTINFSDIDKAFMKEMKGRITRFPRASIDIVVV